MRAVTAVQYRYDIKAARMQPYQLIIQVLVLRVQVGHFITSILGKKKSHLFITGVFGRRMIL